MNASRCSECGTLSSSGPHAEDAFMAAPGTRHHALFTTNEPPEPSEIPFIQSVISKADARIACLDDEISRIQEKLKKLEEERASLSSYRMRNRSILSPLRRMPPEVLGEIFWWTLPSLASQLDRRGFDTTNSPWVLTQISSSWRAISIATSSLWSRVIIDYSETRDPSSAYPLPLAEAQIHRAQVLKIHFYGSETADSRPQIQMFQLLSQHCSRWEELSLGLTSVLIPLLISLRGQFASLQRLWLEWSDLANQAAVQPIDCFESASSLVEFGAFNEYHVVPIALPIHQLTCFQMYLPWKEYGRILRHTFNLVEARLVIASHDSDPWPDTDETIHLLQLRHLYVSDSKILDYLKTPALVGLALDVGENEEADHILQHLDPFAARSACLLRRLSLSGFPDARTATQMLQKLPFITELTITIEDSSARFGINLLMSDLTVSQFPERTVVAPQLRCMFFGCESESFFNYGQYLRMLESRWRAPNCALKAAALLTEVHGPDSATLRGLHALSQQGLDFWVVEGHEARIAMKPWYYAVRWN
ncbi:ABC protein [Mycena venus]|uniref:ABC protein n=1 Tax=Mycena venus TaxID=2733690 RepID=A0A8H6XS53_9AGAR|nr:ABC protein [Mycena venus]